MYAINKISLFIDVLPRRYLIEISYHSYIPANSCSTKIWRCLARNLRICKNVIFDNVWILSKNHPKAFQMFPTSITACKNRALFLPCTLYCAIWLVDFWPITILAKDILIYLHCSVLHFPIKNSSNKSTKSTSCLFSFLTSWK